MSRYVITLNVAGAWAPVHAWCALVAAYHSTFFAVLTPPGASHA